jgi:hypothetical protein
VNARLRLLGPKQRDRFVGRWLDRVDIAFERRSRANYGEAQNGEKRGRAGALAGNAVGEWQKGRSWTSLSVVADEARYRSRRRWWKRTEGGPPGERLGVGPFGLDGFNVGHGLIAPDPGEGLGSPQFTGRSSRGQSKTPCADDGNLNAQCLQPHPRVTMLLLLLAVLLWTRHDRQTRVQGAWQAGMALSSWTGSSPLALLIGRLARLGAIQNQRRPGSHRG